MDLEMTVEQRTALEDAAAHARQTRSWKRYRALRHPPGRCVARPSSPGPWRGLLGEPPAYPILALSADLLSVPLTPVLGDTLVLLLAIALVVAPFLIGTRLRSPWWAMGPPTAIVALLGPSILQESPSQLALNWQVSSLIQMAVFYGGIAATGVWWGIRRENARRA